MNLPKSFKIAVIDREKRTVLQTWRTDGATANYPMALDETDHRLFVVSRFPAHLLVFDTNTGKIIQSLSAVGDCDDIFYDKKRKKMDASGGEGAISVFEQQDADHYKENARIAHRRRSTNKFLLAGARPLLPRREAARITACRNSGVRTDSLAAHLDLQPIFRLRAHTVSCEASFSNA